MAVSFINECRKFTGNRYHVFLRENIGSQLNSAAFPDNFQFYYLDKRPGSGLLNYRKAVKWFNKLEENIEPDCVISTGGHGYWRPKAPLVSGFNIPHYIYSESPYFDRLSFKKKLYLKFKKRIDHYFYNRVDSLVVQTDDVNRRLKKWIGHSRVFTVSNTVNAYFYENEIFDNKLPVRENNEARFLTLSSYYPHKNLEIIQDVAKLLLERGYSDFRFVMTIPHETFKHKFDEKYQPYIYNIGPVPIRECPSLYRECDYMLLPTLLECFSASYAEAMVMKKPILTSNLGFAHTVCEDAAVYFDPLSPGDIAEKIIWLHQHPEKQKELTDRGTDLLSRLNTPESRAEQFLSICMETANL